MSVNGCTSQRPVARPNADQQGCAPGRDPANDQVGGAKVSFKDGHLDVKGSKGADDIKLERVDADTVKLTVNGETRTYDNVKSADIKGGKGDDKIDVASDLGLEALSIDGGKGKDTIRNQATPSDSLECGAANPFSAFKNGKTTIRGGKGDDDIVSDADRAKIYGGKGDDTVTATGTDLEVHGGRGADKLNVTGDRAEVHGGRGKDDITVKGNDAVVRAGRGDDKLDVTGDRAEVHGGRGRDDVHVKGNRAKVRTGLGRDNVNVEGNDARVNPGRARDVVNIQGTGQVVG